MAIIKDRAWQKVSVRGIEWDGIPIEKLSMKNLRRALVFSMMQTVRLQTELEEAMEEVDQLNEVNQKLREEANG